MMKDKARAASLLVLVALIGVCGCESREHSLKREAKYLRKHPPEEVAHYYRGVPYAVVDGYTLTLDVSAPEGEGPFPGLMIIHGGGWELHTNRIMEGMARYITNRGYVVFNINYRTVPEGVRLKEIVEDVLSALAWVKEHAAEYKADPARLCVTGDSAGGHLTAMVITKADNPAFTPTGRTREDLPDLSVACAIPTYGVYDFPALAKLVPSMVEKVIGVSYKEDPELYRLLSPIYHVRKDLPPQLVMVGNRDPLYQANLDYVEALKKAGAQVELWVYPGQTHAFLNYYWKKNGKTGYDKMIEFLDRQTK